MSRLWFMPATPVLSNGGTARGLPISCFLNEASDTLEGILGLWNENVWLASKGGGIGSRLGKPACPRARDRRACQHPRVRGRAGGAVAAAQAAGVFFFVSPGDGQPDAGDQPGFAAARVRGGVPPG